MCSLSNSMATFKIHEDDENAIPNLSAKLKETLPAPTRRVALGEIKNNVIDKPLGIKSEKPLGAKSLPPPKDTLAKSVNSCAVENASCTGRENPANKILAPPASDGKETLAENVADADPKVEEVKQQIAKPHRSPLKEIKNDNTLKTALLSPMWIDDSPSQDSDTTLVSVDDENETARHPTSDAIKLQLEDLYSCATYQDDIFQYLKERETLFRPKPYYMKRQPDIGNPMRTILVDWLVEVGEEYKLNHSTLFMTVNFVDRFLSSMAVVRKKLQLLGTAAMFLASKFEEIYPPEASEFTYITDDSYTKKQVLKMESLIVKVLDFNLSTPTSYTFIMHLAAMHKLPDRVVKLAIYICELALLEADPYLEFLPSMVASGALALAYQCLDELDIWPRHLSSSTGYSLKQLAPVINCLNETHAKSFSAKQVASKDKYRSTKYLFVSEVPHKKLSIRV